MTTAIAATDGVQQAVPMSFDARQHLRAIPSAGSAPQTDTTHDVQLRSETVTPDLDDSNSIEFMGKRFGLAESIGLMPLLKFAHAAKAGLSTDDMEGLTAMYLLIRACLDQSQVQARNDDGTPEFDAAGEPVWAAPSQWHLFEAHAVDTNADGEALSAFINEAVQVVAARPTKRRGDSSASSQPTSASSRESSSSPGTRPVPPGFEGLTAVSTIGQAP